MKTIVYNGKIYTPFHVYENGIISIDDGIIMEIVDTTDIVRTSSNPKKDLEQLVRTREPDEVIDAKDHIISPGYIGIHEHGLDGKEFNNISEADLKAVLAKYLEFGVTSVSPTLATDSVDNIRNTLQTIFKVARKNAEAKKPSGARLLKAHLESWYFNPAMGGAQNKAYLKDANLDEFIELMRESFAYIGIVTLAPERNGSLEFIKKVKELYPEIVFSIGHSNATMRDTRLAIELGARLINHIYNRMSMEKDYAGYRADLSEELRNVVRAALKDKRVFAELVLDFVHINQSDVKSVIDRISFERAVMVTDSSAMAGSGRYTSTLAGKECKRLEENGYEAAYIVEKDERTGKEKITLAGSVLTMDQGVRNLFRLDYPLEKVLQTATTNPVICLGKHFCDRRGSLEMGKYADIIFLNTFLEVRGTMVGGELLYNKDNSIEKRQWR